MCGICAIITPYDVDLGYPAQTPTPGLSPGLDGTATPFPASSVSTPSSISNSDIPPASMPTKNANLNSSSHLNLYAASFRYKDARPKSLGAEAPYTEIQRPRSVSRSRPSSRVGSVAPATRTREQLGVRGNNGDVDGNGLGDEDESEGGQEKTAGMKAKRDPAETSIWVDTAQADQAALEGRDPASKAIPTSSSESTDAPKKTPEPPTSAYRTRLETELLGSLETIAHRGPDGKGIWIGEDCRVALGHVRWVDSSWNCTASDAGCRMWY